MGLILVVSEDSVDIETIRGALSVHGWWVTLAGDGEAALQIAADQAPKLVVVDHALPGGYELIRNFGARGGGPGVLVTAPEGSDLSLELAEAGADEVLTKPVSAPNVVEAVKRCLAAPAPAQPVRAASSAPLMTTDDIFGDVLREVEGEVAGGASAESRPSALAEPTPAAPVVGSVAEAAPKPPPAAPEQPVVSLAGLFDDETDAAEAARQAAAVEPAGETRGGGSTPGESEAHIDSLWSSDESSQSPKREWDGTERRTDERPWSSDVGSEPFAADGPTQDPAPTEAEGAALPVEQEPPLFSKQSQASAAEESEPVGLDEVNLAATESSESVVVVDEPVVAGEGEGSGRSSAIVWAAGIAAVLLVAAGIYFALRPDGSPEPTAERPSAAPVAAVPTAAAESEVAEGLEVEPATGTDAVGALSTAPAPVETQAAERSAAAETEGIDEIDLEAIVEQELGKREEELRRVFVEEEKRLLRELRELDEAEPPEESDGSQDDDESDGVGR